MPRHSETNGLGIAGFVVSLVGFFACPILPPIGAIMSAFALKREPRGLAIAGLIIGIVGSLGLIALIALIGVFGLAAVLAAIGLAGAAPQLEGTIDMARIDAKIEQFVQDNGAPPESLDALRLDEEIALDHWDRPYRYEVAADGTWVLASDGEDGEPGTDDDIVFEE